MENGNGGKLEGMKNNKEGDKWTRIP